MIVLPVAHASGPALLRRSIRKSILTPKTAFYAENASMPVKRMP
jgi:hypothetical protein